MTTSAERSTPSGAVQHLNPDALPKNPAFTQAVVVSGPAKTIYIGMQNAVDASRTIVGKGDLAAQTEQTLKNVQACLEAAGARPEHLIQWTIYVAHGQSIQAAYEVGQRWWGIRPNPPANTVILVPAFVPPDFLIGIEAIAVVPGE
jgi:enamine deaminase RidA (YjgF/YER057c/UK114 family)